MPNRLAYEDSPYLQQHKENPVDWLPWCDEAFERAEKEHKAIFISIGYSSCHWCHVMEYEVFEDEAIAEVLNEHFICIKVDREERPDIDKHYQGVHQLLNRRPGGWPTSIFCTPQNKPFFAGTYIPPTSRDRMMGFSELIGIIAQKVGENDEQLFKNADEISSYLEPKTRSTQAAVIKAEIGEQFFKQAEQNFEPTCGGFSVAPKFPHTSTLNTLLDFYLLEKSDRAREIVTVTLNNMQAGGMYDLIDGGFCRYSVDTQWLVPHFEKMTYDNGLLCELYTRAYRYFGDTNYLKTAREIASFMTGFMMENNLFYSASDADSEGHEGTYFIYTYADITQALSDAGVDASGAEALSCTPQGNFEGKNIIRFNSLSEPDWFERLRPALSALRKKRAYPFIDRKVQTSWNAMMIKALFELGRFDDAYLSQAKRSLDALLEKMFVNGTLYHSALIDREPKVEAFLEDYAYLCTTLLGAYDITHDESCLIRAQHFANMALERYYDNGKWLFSAGEFTTEADLSDSSYPGAVGVITDALLSLGTLVDQKYRRFAFKSLEYASMELVKRPVYYPYLTAQALRYLKEDRVIKATPESLEAAKAEIAALHYPYTLTRTATQKGYQLCGIQSCFSVGEEAASLQQMLNESL